MAEKNQTPIRRAYFVDDENSKNLFMGYAVAASAWIGQMEELGIQVDEEHPLFVLYSLRRRRVPGGVTFGLKEICAGTMCMCSL